MECMCGTQCSSSGISSYQEDDIRGQHHEPPRGVRVLELLRLFVRCPLEPLEEDEVAVVERSGSAGPWANISGSIGVAAAKCMRAAQGDDLSVVESHLVEGIAQALRRGLKRRVILSS